MRHACAAVEPSVSVRTINACPSKRLEDSLSVVTEELPEDPPLAER